MRNITFKRVLASAVLMLATAGLCSAQKTLDAIFGDATELPAYEVFASTLSSSGNNSWPCMTNFVTWKRVEGSDTDLILVGFCGDTSTEFKFQVVSSSSSNARTSATGRYLRYDTNNNPSRGTGMIAGYAQARGSMWAGYTLEYSWDSSSDRYVIYSIVDDGNGVWSFTNRNAIAKVTNNSSSPDNGYAFNNPHYIFAPVNCEISYYREDCTYSYYDNWIHFGSPYYETTQGYFDIDEENGTFRMMNIGDMGGAMGLSTLNRATVNYATYFDGTVDPENKTFQFEYDDNVEGQKGFLQVFANGKSLVDCQYYLTSIDTETLDFNFKTIGGTYSNGQPAHNNAKNGWVTNGGSRKTLQGKWMKFDDPFTFAYPDGIQYQSCFTSAFSEMTFGSDEQDVTLDAELEISKYALNSAKDEMQIEGTVTLKRNTALLAEDGGIDVMMVDGEVEGADINNHTPHDELGLEGATELVKSLSKDAAAMMTYAADSEYITIPFSKTVSKAEDPNVSENRTLSLFIRGRYHADHNLTPTFHSLQTVSNPSTTGITEASAVANAHVEFFDLQGRSCGYELPTTAGVYIRRVGATSTKVVVK